jgi:hypothetical protein
MLRIVTSFVFTLAICTSLADAAQPGSPAPATVSSNAPIDQLIPWLLNEDRQLRGIPFSDLIFAATGKRVLAFDPQNEVDQRVVKQISAACHETIKRLNAPDSVIQNVERINEVSSRFEDTLCELLSSASGLSCDSPRTIDEKCNVPAIPIYGLLSVRADASSISTQSFMRLAAVTAVPAHFISNRKKRRTRCVMTRCISSSGSNTSGGRKREAGNSRAGTLSIFPISR